MQAKMAVKQHLWNSGCCIFRGVLYIILWNRYAGLHAYEPWEKLAHAHSPRYEQNRKHLPFALISL